MFIYILLLMEELIGRIQNQSSHDYGCTSIEIVRAGTGQFTILEYKYSKLPYE
jgi:hypothetical protein